MFGTPLRDAIADPNLLPALPVEEAAGILLSVIAEDTLNNGMVNLGQFTQEVERWSGLHHHNQQLCRQAIAESFWWLHNNNLIIPSPSQAGSTSWFEITRRGAEIVQEGNFEKFRQATSFPRTILHPQIAVVAWPSYLRGDFETAIFTAFKEVEVAVRDAARLDADAVGTRLMRTAFDKNTGPLTDYDLIEGEREAQAHFFAGAIGSYKNPSSHRRVSHADPIAAGELLMLASHMMRVLDDRMEALRMGRSR